MKIYIILKIEKLLMALAHRFPQHIYKKKLQLRSDVIKFKYPAYFMILRQYYNHQNLNIDKHAICGYAYIHKESKKKKVAN